jgi:hypothetical protein
MAYWKKDPVFLTSTKQEKTHSISRIFSTTRATIAILCLELSPDSVGAFDEAVGRSVVAVALFDNEDCDEWRQED